MRAWVKVLIALAVFAVLGAVAAGLLMRFYFKPEKIRSLVVSRAEETLGRKVVLGQVEVGLFKGIYLKDLAIKEADGRTDFLRVKALRVRLALWPILRRELVFTKAEILGPYLRVVRRKDGSFNWEDLKVFSREPGASKEGRRLESQDQRAKGLPFLLVVPRFEVRDGYLIFKDETGALPNLEVPFALEASLSPEWLRARLDFRLLNEPYQLSVHLEDYLTAPEGRLSLTGKRLDLNRFASSAPKSKKASEIRASAPNRSGEEEILLPPLPFKRFSAELDLKEVVYRKLVLSGVRASATFDRGRLVSDIECRLAGGLVRDHIEADLRTQSPSWKVRETGEGLQVVEILSGLYPDLPGGIRGTLSYDGNFTGRGLSLKKALDSLSGYGVFEVRPLELADIPVTRKLSQVLSLEELRTLLFDYARGSFRVSRRRCVLKAELAGRMLSAQLSSGTFFFDGRLDMPVDLTFSPDLSKKLTTRLPLAANLKNEKGQVELTVHLKGPYRKPRVVLRSRAVERRLKEKLREILPEPLRGLPLGR